MLRRSEVRTITKSALCIGSIAFDLVMNIIPSIREEIPLVQGQIKSLNLAFVSPKAPIVLRGGTAGNIAFGIGFLGSKVCLFSVVGHDFYENYGKLLEQTGVNLRVKTIKDELTARSYQITDPNREQIIIWQPNAMRLLEETSLFRTEQKLPDASEISVVIFSPGSAISTVKHMKEIAEIYPNAYKIFDPGQMVMTYSTEQFKTCLNLSNMIIINDAEVLKARERGLKKEEIHIEYPNLTLIETLGEKGAHYFLPDKTEWFIGVVPEVEIVEPTGAGDAFRAGLISAYLDGNSWVEAGKSATALASVCIESNGAQGYETVPLTSIRQRINSIDIIKLK